MKKLESVIFLVATLICSSYLYDFPNYNHHSIGSLVRLHSIRKFKIGDCLESIQYKKLPFWIVTGMDNESYEITHIQHRNVVDKFPSDRWFYEDHWENHYNVIRCPKLN